MDERETQNNFNRETDSEIHFYTPIYYCFDNFSAFKVNIWGKVFDTAEHAYQWKKFHKTKPAIAKEINDAKSPNAVKKISDAHRDKVSEEFKKNKLSIMKEIVVAKTEQHEKVKRMLLQSGEKVIIENSPIDEYWGIGSGYGENHLGKIWMEIRDELQ